MENLVNASIKFMKELTNHYGEDEGMRHFYAVVDVIPDEVKNSVFMKLLTSAADTDGYITLTGVVLGYTIQPDRVSAVKELRVVTGLGLKEAVDIVRLLETGGSYRLKIYEQRHALHRFF